MAGHPPALLIGLLMGKAIGAPRPAGRARPRSIECAIRCICRVNEPASPCADCTCAARADSEACADAPGVRSRMSTCADAPISRGRVPAAADTLCVGENGAVGGRNRARYRREAMPYGGNPMRVPRTRCDPCRSEAEKRRVIQERRWRECEVVGPGGQTTSRRDGMAGRAGIRRATPSRRGRARRAAAGSGESAAEPGGPRSNAARLPKDAADRARTRRDGGRTR
jgi:hypothetical protein